jgi:tRNA pseudouridine(38-40) synthase
LQKTCGYSRCGRTDRGVSALGQIVALKVRSSIPTNVELTDDNAELREMDYCTMLNRCLPEEIRVLGWTAVTDEFSSRFSASNRRYRYFFARRNLDVAAMQQACQYLLGSHDFRNLCKLDVANVSNFVREIYSAEIKPFRIHDEHEVVYMLEICGIAFLWHMVRCIMAVLFLVGEGKESPEIVRDLLDLTVYASKPSYMMADDAPLVLHECAFDHLALHHSVRSLWELTSHYRLLQDRHAVAMAQAFNALQHLEASCVVSRTDLNAFKEELRGKQARVAKRLESKGIQKTAVGAAAAAAASAPTDGDGATVGKKRSFADMETDAAVAAAAGVESDRVSWTQALKEIQSELSLHPSPDTAPHVPLSQRKREESYEERVKTLVGQKKVRLSMRASLLHAVVQHCSPLPYFVA